MKRLISFMLIIFLIFPLTACGISKEELNKVSSEKDSIQTELNDVKGQLSEIKSAKDKLQSDYDALLSQYNTLKEDTADWEKLSAEEKAEKLAQAEADRIAAEEAAKKAKAEQEAAEKAAAEEAAKKAAEEEAAREAEKKKGYETGITYDNLARDPDLYKDKKVKFKGEVLQVTEDSGITVIRLATEKNSWGGYSDDVILLYIPQGLIKSRILEEDIITIYGVAKGLHTYETVLGSSITIPLVYADKID